MHFAAFALHSRLRRIRLRFRDRPAKALFAAILALPASPLVGQTTLFFNNGENNGTEYDSTSNSLTLNIASGSANQNGTVYGTGEVIKNGAGTIVLTPNTSYTGGTSIDAGTLVLAGTTSSSVFDIKAGATLEIAVASGTRDHAAATTYTGAGTLSKTGAGTVQWGTSAATFALASGALIDIQAGTFFGGSSANENWTANLADLHVASGATFAGVEANVRVDALTGSGTITSGYNGAGYSAFTFGVDGGSGTFSGVLAETDTGNGHIANFTKAGSGTQILTGTNTYTGTTTISGGTLQLGDGITNGSLASASIVNHGTLVLNRTDDYTFNTIVSGTGGLVHDGYVLRLVNPQTYTGPTTVKSGAYLVLSTSADHSLSASTSVDLESGSFLDLSNRPQTIAGLSGAGSVYSFVSGGDTPAGHLTVDIATGQTFDFSGVLGHTLPQFGLTKTGPGTQILSGANTYTGATTINVGTLAIAADSALGAAPASATPGHLSLDGGTLATTATFTLDARRGIALGASGGSLSPASATTLSYSGIIAGSGALTKSGPGTLTLTGANTYTGGTTVSAGTLVGDATSLQGTIANSAALTFDQASVGSYSGTLTGTGTLTKQGPGSLTLASANSYSGNTSVDAGTLVLAGTTASPNFNIASGATLALLVDVGTRDNLAATTFTGSGTLAKTGAGTAQWGASGATFALGTGALIDVQAGTLTGGFGANEDWTANLADLHLASGATFAGGEANVRVDSLTGSGTIASGLNGAGYTAFTFGVDGGSGTFSGVLVDTDASNPAHFTKAGSGTQILTGTNTYTGTTTVASGTLTLASSSALGTTDGTTTVASGATLSLTNDIVVAEAIANAGTVTNSSGANTLSGVLSGSGTVAVAGGSLSLSGANTYTGTTSVNAGSLILASSAALGTADADTTVASGASLSLTNDIVVAEAIANAGTVTNTSGTNTLSGVLSGSGTVTVAGGTVTLSGVNTYTGTTSVNAGSLILASSTALGTTAADTTVASGATLAFTNDITVAEAIANAGAVINTSGTNTLSGVLSGSGTVAVAGGTFALSGVNTYTGATTVSTGTLSIAADSALGTAPGTATPGHLTLNGGTLATTATFTLDAHRGIALGTSGGILSPAADTTLSYGGIIAGSGSLTKTGSGTLTLSGLNTYTGATTITGGTLAIAADSTLGPAPGSATAGHLTLDGGTLVTTTTFTLSSNRGLTFGTSGGTLDIADGTTLTYATPIVGDFTKSGAGTLELTSLDSLAATQARDIAAGTLHWNTPNGSFYVFQRGVLSGEGNLIVTGNASSAHEFQGVNTFTGTTTLRGGHLFANADSAFGTAPSTASPGHLILEGATLRLSATFTLDANRGLLLESSGGTIDTDGRQLTYGGIVTGTGSLTKTGAGTLILSGVNTYSGGTTISGGTLVATSASIPGDIINSSALVFDQSTSGTFANVISGSGSLGKTGSGTVTLSGLNTYTGTTTIAAGTLAIAADSALGTAPGSATPGHLTLDGGTLATTADFTLASTRGLTFGASSGSLDVAAGTTLTYSNAITGNFTKSGAGTLALTHLSPIFQNNINIAAGTLDWIGGPGIYYSGQEGIISGAGNLKISNNTTQSGTRLHGANTYTGTTTLGVGLIDVLADSGFGTAPETATPDHLIFEGGSLRPGTSFTLNANRGIQLTAAGGEFTDYLGHQLVYGGIIAGTGSLTVSGNIGLILSGANTYFGATFLPGGSLTLGRSDALQNSTVTITGGTLAFGDLTAATVGGLAGTTGLVLHNGTSAAVALSVGNNQADTTYSGTLQGSGTLTKIGSGTLTLANVNTFSGDTTISAGTLELAHADALQNSTLTTAAGLSFGSLTAANLGGLTGSDNLALSNAAAAAVTLSVGGNDSTTTYAGALSGPGVFAKTGSGTLTLTGTNTHTGGTTINEGSLSLAADSALGTAPGSATPDHLTLDGGILSTSATFTLDSNRGIALGSSGGTVSSAAATTLSYGGIIAGSGALTKTGPGTLALTGANTYSGGTTVSAGTLVGTSTSLQGDIANSAAVSFDQATDGTYSGVLSGSGALTKTGAGNLTLSGANTHTGLTSVSAGILTLGHVNALQNSTLTTATGLSFGNLTAATLGGLTGAQGLALSNNSSAAVALSVGGNDTTTTYSGIFSGPGSLTKVGTGTFTLSGANTHSGGTTISAGTLALGHADAVQNSTVTLAGGVLDFGAFTTARLGGLAGSSALALTNGSAAAVALSVGANDASSTYSGILSGSGTLTKSGTGTLTLAGANTYSGATTVNGGTLVIAADSALGAAPGSATPGHLTLDGGTFATTATFTLDAHRGIALGSSGGTVSPATGTTLTYGGIIAGSGTLTKSGPGTLTLTGANTYTGGTTVSGGTLVGTTTSLQGDIASSAAVSFDQATDGTYAGAISGPGALIKTGAGNLTLSGIHTHTGGTTLSSGTLTTAPANLSGNIVNQGAFVLQTPDDATFSGNLSGPGSFTKSGSGHLTIAGTNIHTGLTTLSAGTVTISPVGHIGGDIANSGTLVFNRSDDYAYFGTISGTGGLVHDGYILRFDKVQTYTGPTAIKASAALALSIHADQGLSSSSTVDVEAGGVFDFSNRALTLSGLTGAGAVYSFGGLAGHLTLDIADTNTFAGILGAGAANFALSKTGAGSLIFTGTNTYTGTTTVSAGTLQIGDGGTTGTLGAGPVVNNASLVFNRSDKFSYAGDISGSGSLTQSGPGTLALSGNNTYTGNTTVSAGTLFVDATQALYGGTIDATNAARVSVAGGAVLGLGVGGPSSFSVADITVIATHSGFATGAKLALDTTSATGGAATLADLATGAADLQKTGAGALLLTGATTGTGTVDIIEGTLGFATPSTFAGGSVNATHAARISVAGGATLALGFGGVSSFTTSDIATVAQNAGFASGSSLGLDTTFATGGAATLTDLNFGATGFAKTGTGSLTLAGTTTLSGSTTVAGGELILGSDALLGAAPATATDGHLTLNGGTLITQSTFALEAKRGVALGAAGGSFDTAAATTLTVAGNVTGTGALTKTGTGALILAQGTAGTGALTVSNGTLQIGDGGATSLGATRVTNHGTIAFNHSTDLILAGTLDGTGNFSKTGSGTLTVTSLTSNGSIAVTGGNLISITDIDNRIATISGSTSSITDTGSLNDVGNTGTGSLTVTAGGSYLLTSTGSLNYLTLGTATGGHGTVTVNGTASNVTSNGRLRVGGAGAGILNLEAGAAATFNQASDSYVGNSTTGVGTVSLSGTDTSLALVARLIVGNSGTGTVNLGSGATLTADRLLLAANTGSTGTLHLNEGGTLVVSDANGTALGSGLGTATVNFAGGTLRSNGTHGLTVTSDITLADATTSTVDTNGQSGTISGVLSGTGALAKTGSGTLTLASANTYSGGTTVQAGTLTAGHAAAFGTGSITVTGGVLDVGGYAIGNTINASGGTLSGLTNFSGTHTVASGTASYSGSVGGNLAVNSGGTLHTTGATFTGTINVASGGTLSGTGLLSTVTVASGGTLSPGNSPGLLTVGDGSVFSGTLNMELGGLLRGTGYDAIDVSGGGSLSVGGTLNVTVINGFAPALGNSFNLLNFTSISGTFAAVNLPSVGSGLKWDTSTLYNNGTITISAVPEPATFAGLAGLMTLALAGTRRRRRCA